jgi:hypothetical protein
VDRSLIKSTFTLLTKAQKCQEKYNNQSLTKWRDINSSFFILLEGPKYMMDLSAEIILHNKAPIMYGNNIVVRLHGFFCTLYTIVLFICLSSARQLKCLRVSKTESYGISRICFEMTRQATMPLSSAEVSSSPFI